MYGPEIIEARFREIHTEVARSTAYRVHRSIGERLRALRDRAAR